MLEGSVPSARGVWSLMTCEDEPWSAWAEAIKNRFEVLAIPSKSQNCPSTISPMRRRGRGGLATTGGMTAPLVAFGSIPDAAAAAVDV